MKLKFTNKKTGKTISITSKPKPKKKPKPKYKLPNQPNVG